MQPFPEIGPGLLNHQRRVFIGVAQREKFGSCDGSISSVAFGILPKRGVPRGGSSPILRGVHGFLWFVAPTAGLRLNVVQVHGLTARSSERLADRAGLASLTGDTDSGQK